MVHINCFSLFGIKLLYCHNERSVFFPRLTNQYINQKATSTNSTCCCLLLVTAARATTTSTLELASLGSDIGAGVRVGHTRSLTEVLAGSTSGASALEQKGVLAGGRTQSQLIEGQDLTASLQDTLASRLGDMQGAQRQLGHHQEAGIVGNGANNNNSRLRLLGGLEEASNALQRHWWPIGFAHKQTLQNDAVKLLVCTTLQETVQL